MSGLNAAATTSLLHGQVTARLRAESPEIELSGPFGAVLGAALDWATAPGAMDARWVRMFRSLGALAVADGLSGDSLRRVFQVAAEVAGRPVIAARIAEVATVCAAGYTAARDPGEESMVMRRRRLFHLVMANEPDEELAREVNWPMPRTAIGIALARLGTEPLGELGPNVLAGEWEGRTCLIVRAGDPVLKSFPHRCPGWRAAIGIPAPLAEVSGSLAVAVRALDLVERYPALRRPVIDCMAESVNLLLFTDGYLLEQLIDRRLAPLADLMPKQRERMLATLHEWLSRPGRGQAEEAAKRLGVHVQTFRYRVRKLQEMFGSQFSEPHGRLDLELATRAALLRTSHYRN
ncbi:PucR family transcriptional regulator [Actinosynnema sp. ALI-1.44]|uniref:PucR family transcriptional regulator n=1 Tax=Actinosynnema sp. ALI-1.44 TaxID=1933779 RepID=UPI001178C607|nr:helix-turn-helix domain-containing protein [Actinosynnema sp. ALI-1.44]